jgi:hypothetical protein
LENTTNPTPSHQQGDNPNTLPIQQDKSSNLSIYYQLAQEFGINERQRRFCELYTNHDEHRGNGIQCYAMAYNVDLSKPGSYNAAKVNASRLLTKDNVLKYMAAIFEHSGLNDLAANQELLFTIRQNADFGSKVAGLRLWYDLNGKLNNKKVADAIQFNINIAPQNSTETGQVISIETKQNTENQEGRVGVD